MMIDLGQIKNKKGVESKNGIPFIFLQTVKNLNIDEMFYDKIIRPTMFMNQDFEFRFFDNEHLEKVIYFHFPARIHQAFLKINPKFGSCVADFGRYCLLYVYGGVYLDIKSQTLRSIKPLVERKEKDLLMVSYWAYKGMHKERLGLELGEIQNWVILSSPRHPVIMEVIEEMTKRIYEWRENEEELIKYQILELTGPLMFTDVLKKNLWREDLLLNEDINNYFEYMSEVCEENNLREIFYKSQNMIPYENLENESIIY